MNTLGLTASIQRPHSLPGTGLRLEARQSFTGSGGPYDGFKNGHDMERGQPCPRVDKQSAQSLADKAVRAPGLNSGEGEDDCARRIGRSIAYMAQHLDQPLQVSTLAAQASVSPSHYFALFRQHTGSAPIAYFIRLRMRQACQLLETTSLTVKEVAGVLGYDDPFYFSRLFKSVTGTAPRAYRGMMLHKSPEPMARQQSGSKKHTLPFPSSPPLPAGNGSRANGQSFCPGSAFAKAFQPPRPNSSLKANLV